MADPSETPSFDPPAMVPEDEVERLIHDAEALTAEIAGLVDPTNDGGRQPAGAPLPDERDPVEATEDVGHQILQLDDIVGGGDFESLEREDAAGAELPQHGDMPRRQVAGRSERSVDAGSTAVDGSARAGSDRSGARDPAGKAVRLAAGMLSRAIRRRVEGEAPTPPAADAAIGEGDAEPTARPPLADRFKRAVRGALRSSVGAARDVGCSVPNAFLRVVVLLDAPFRGIPATAKRHIGIIAVITLAMGLAALLLPAALDDNPYREPAAESRPAQ